MFNIVNKDHNEEMAEIIYIDGKYNKIVEVFL